MTSSGGDMTKLLQKFKDAKTGEKEKKIEDEDERRPTVSTNQVKKTDDPWDDDEDSQEVSKKNDAKNTGGKKKTTSKNNQPAAWTEAQHEILIDDPKEKETPQKGVMRKPGANRAAKPEILEEEFPDLGAEIDPSKIKSKPKPQQQPQTTATTTTQSGPKRFTNTKKPVGETFAQIESTPEKTVEEQHEEKPEPQITATETTKPEPLKQQGGDAPKQQGVEAPKQQGGGFGLQRGPNRAELASKADATKNETSTETPAPDSKFKFGGDGPRKFVSSKKEGQPSIREEHKTEADLKREEAERRAEEALQAKKAKIASERERDSKKKLGHKNERPVDKQDDKGGEKNYENGKTGDGHHDGPHKKDHDGKPREKQGEKKSKNDEFLSKDDKGGDKTKKEAQPTKEQAPKEELSKGLGTQIIKTDQKAALSQTGWDMPIKKSSGSQK